MDYHGVNITPPLYPNDVVTLVEAINNQANNLESLFSISPALAELNRERYAQWDNAATTPAAWSYRGETFLGLSIQSLTPDQQAYAQSHIFILSGLYGLLRPQDGIKPYRLEMRTRLVTDTAANLYDYWGGRLADMIASNEDDYILNCASAEYAKAIMPHTSLPVITPKFLHNGRSKMAFAKYSRGLLARWCAINQPRSIKDLQKFNLEGYIYDEVLSTPNEPVYIAPKNFTIAGRFKKKVQQA